MKSAIIFYGFCRTFDFCQESLKKHILNIVNPDIYINTPSTLYAPTAHEVPEFHKSYSKNTEPSYYKICQSLKDFSIKNIEIRNYDSSFYKDYVNNHNLKEKNDVFQYSWRVVSTLHSISLSVQSFKNYVTSHGLHYDLVILTRPDLKYYKDFNIDSVQLSKVNYPSKFLYSIHHHDLCNLPFEEKIKFTNRVVTGAAAVFGFPGVTFNDQFICGSQDNIIKFYDVFDNIINYYNSNIILNTETYLGYHCINNKLDFGGSDMTIYDIWREDTPEYI